VPSPTSPIRATTGEDPGQPFVVHDGLARKANTSCMGTNPARSRPEPARWRGTSRDRR
jgi:hypothetical protein